MPGGQWYFDYGEGEDDDEIGFRLSDERFVPGEYVSISSDGKMRTIRSSLSSRSELVIRYIGENRHDAVTAAWLSAADTW